VESLSITIEKEASQILEQLEKTKTIKMEFVGIRVGLEEMNKWTEDNLDAPEVLPRMISWESELNHAFLSTFQQIGENMERDLKIPLGIFTNICRATIILSIKFHFPLIV